MNPAETKHDVLARCFGHGAFREGQEAAIDAILEGRPALALFPTGAGKSLCYQLPALMLEGLTLVVSPLIALMRDQVEALLARGVRAARLDSTLEAAEVSAIYRAMADGTLSLLYVAPERLANEGFLRRLRGTKLALLAIDEAHCVSEWGHNFRPDYLKLAALARELGVQRLLALTATATPRVAGEICERFGIEERDLVRTSFRRPNLAFRASPCSATERDALLLQRLREGSGAAVVYVTLQHTAESVAGYLKRHGVEARAYHAGMRDEDRSEVQDLFMANRVEVVVATIAFGMGIDKPDIRRVLHYNLPKSLENYVQESGRAGRDGAPAVCEILACADDLTVLRNFIYGDTPAATAVKSLVEHVLLQGERFSVSRYDLSQSRDMRPSVVATALTYLELEGAISPTGPFYSGYRVRFFRSLDSVLAGHTPERQRFLRRIFEAAEQGRLWHRLEPAAVAEATGESEDRIRRAVSYLAESGEAEVQPSGLRHGYRLTAREGQTVAALTQLLVERFESQEGNEVARLGEVVAYAESERCRVETILDYFGERGAPCGNCDVCEGAARPGSLPGSPPARIDAAALQAIQDLRRENHPALRHGRQLARFLCGLSSPATTRARLSRNERFGLLAEVPFEEVLAQLAESGC